MILDIEITKAQEKLDALKQQYQLEGEAIPARQLRCIVECLQRDVSTLSERIHKLELFCHSINPEMACKLGVLEELPY